MKYLLSLLIASSAFSPAAQAHQCDVFKGMSNDAIDVAVDFASTQLTTLDQRVHETLESGPYVSVALQKFKLEVDIVRLQTECKVQNIQKGNR